MTMMMAVALGGCSRPFGDMVVHVLVQVDEEDHFAALAFGALDKVLAEVIVDPVMATCLLVLNWPLRRQSRARLSLLFAI